MLAIQLVSQLCPTLCDPMDCNPLGSSVHGISQQEYWSGLAFPTPGDLAVLGIEPVSLKSPALAGRLFTLSFLFLECLGFARLNTALNMDTVR